LKGLMNETRVSKSNIGSDHDLYSSTSYLISGTRSFNKRHVNHNYMKFALLNDLSYRFGVSKDRIKTAIIFQYNDQISIDNFRSAYYLGKGGRFKRIAFI